MAVDKKFSWDDEDNKGIPQTGALSFGQGIPSGMAMPQQKQATPSRFATLQKYLEANVPAGERMAQTIGTKATRDISKGQEAAQQQAEAVRSGIQAGQKTLQTGRQLAQDISQTTFDPTQFIEQPGFQQFQALQAGQGISESDIQNRLAQAQIAQQRALQQAQTYLAPETGIQTQAGRFKLLQQAYGMTPGQVSGLDVALLQTGRGGEELRKLQRGLTEQTLGLQTRGEQVAQLGQEAARLGQTERDVMAGLQGAVTGLTSRTEKEYRDKFKAEQEKQNELLKQYQEKLMSGALTDAELSALGLSELSGTRIYNVPLEQYLTAGPAATLEERIGESDLKKIKALRMLAGQPEFMGEVSEAKAEKYNPFKYDVTGLKSALAPYEEQYEQVHKRINELQTQPQAFDDLFRQFPSLRGVKTPLDWEINPYGPEEDYLNHGRVLASSLQTPQDVTALLDKIRNLPHTAMTDTGQTDAPIDFLTDILRSNPNVPLEAIRDTYGIHGIDDYTIGEIRNLAQIEQGYKQLPNVTRQLGISNLPKRREGDVLRPGKKRPTPGGIPKQ